MGWEKASTVKVESVLMLGQDGTRVEHAVVTMNEDSVFYWRKFGIDKQVFDKIKKTMNWK